MNKKIWKNIIGIMVLSILTLSAFAMTAPRTLAQAQGELDLWSDPVLGQPDYGAEKLNEIGLGKKDPRAIAANIIQILLGLLGVIAVVIILIGGFKWMTAVGNEDKVSEAKKLLGAGIIGLLIVLAAWALAMFIISRFLYSTGGQGWQSQIYQPD